MSQSAIQVLKTIGIPSIINGDSSLEATTSSLEEASRNKVRLFYLETLNGHGLLADLAADLSASEIRRQKILDLTVLLSTLFEDHKIPYAIMKTLKPFPYEGSDVDVLIGSPETFSQAIKTLKQNGFTMLGNDLFSATLYRQDFDANVDLQLQLSVSGLPYLDKQTLLNHSTQRIVNGNKITTLSEPSEVLVVAAHSFYKEHMYTLADFYTTALLTKKEVSKELCTLAKQTNTEFALFSLLSWVQKVTSEVFRIGLPVVVEIKSCLTASFVSNFLATERLALPQKFPKTLIFSALMERFVNDRTMRSSMPRALLTSFSSEQYRNLVHHFSSPSY